jgi:pimeloyl-ACP methyl ester carboxylesterase
MQRRLAIFVLFSVLLAGSYSMGFVPTEKMQVRQMRVNGVDLAYVEEGRGETVVFVHGAFGDWRNWEGMRPAIAERYRFVSLSLRYHYPNAWPDNGENYSIAQHVEDVAQFIRQLNVGKVHLVGSSFGGRLVGYVALKYPELLRSVVMGEPSIIAPASVEGRAAGAEMGKDIAKSVKAAKSGDDKQAAILLFNAVLNDPDAFRKAPLATQQRVLDNARTLSPYWARPTTLPTTCEQLGLLKVPALVVRGENSRASFRYGNETLLSCLPKNTATAVIPGAPHMWYEANPNAGARAILAFIAHH